MEKGTGRKADIDGYRLGGKTGTAEKVSAQGGYARKALLSSFVAVFPIDEPRYVVLVMLDEPHGTKATGGYATGGAVAAPTLGRVAARIGPILAVDPSERAAKPLPAGQDARARGNGVATN